MRRGRRRPHRRARCRRREARPDAGDVFRGRPGPAAEIEMRLRRQRPAQPRQGVSGLASLRRARARARACRKGRLSGHTEVLAHGREKGIPVFGRDHAPDQRDAMADALRPRDAKDVEGAVQWALAHRKSLEIVGHGTKRSLGRPAQVDATLDLAGLAGVTLYEPEELVLSAGAGTPLSEIEARLDAAGQQLAFEPMDFGPLLGT